MRNMLFILVLALLLAGRVSAVTNVFEYPLVFQRHQQLNSEMQRAMHQRDIVAMERVCRAGVALLPENPVWRYNLACALAVQKRQAEALEALNRAVDLGFRDTRAIAGDEDLASLHDLPAFQQLQAKARKLQGQPVEGQPLLAPNPVSNNIAYVTASNTSWDLETGHFMSFFTMPSNPPPPSAFAPRWSGPASALIRPWMSANLAAGNYGDFYDNRDDNHSRLDCTPFAGLIPIQYDTEARRYGAHYGLNQFLYNGVVLGNSSVALTSGPYWRSLPRGALTEGSTIAFLFTQYMRNHLYCYPSHHDYDTRGLGDLYPVNQPYLLISQGSSGSDQPFRQAAAATLAALQPETKRYLVAHGLITPTLQMLLRASQKCLVRPDDYLTGAAHPAAFDANQLNVDQMVRMAHELSISDIPPVVALRTLADSRATPGLDFFDAVAAETLYDSPCAISRVIRSTAHRHTLTIDAQLTAMPTNGWRLNWVVLSGDPQKVALRPLKADNSQLEISVTYPGGRFPSVAGQPLQSSRVDIGIIASRGSHYSAPSFVSFFYLNNELRTYAADGRILTMDYAAASTNYVDPVLSYAKHWRDEYQYNADKHPIGWIRRQGGTVEHFTLRGECAEQTDALGRALVTHTVNYIPRSSVDDSGAPDLIQVNGETRRQYRYATDQDFLGEVVSQERAGP